MPKLTVSPRKADIDMYSRMAAEGEVSSHAIEALALLHAASRKAESLLGQENFSSAAFMASFPDGSVASSFAVAPNDEDVAKFERLAARGEIDQDAAKPLALVFAATRKAQSAIGRGHLPLDAFMAALPQQYVRNWLSKQGVRA